MRSLSKAYDDMKTEAPPNDRVNHNGGLQPPDHRPPGRESYRRGPVEKPPHARNADTHTKHPLREAGKKAKPRDPRREPPAPIEAP